MFLVCLLNHGPYPVLLWSMCSWSRNGIVKDYEEVNSLVYINAVFKETLRLKATVPYLGFSCKVSHSKRRVCEGRALLTGRANLMEVLEMIADCRHCSMRMIPSVFSPEGESSRATCIIHAYHFSGKVSC